MERIDLLLIDPQNDFCSPDANAKKGTQQENNGVYEGTLYVPGAERDMERLSALIKGFGQKIKNIHTTLDCHHYYDIAHPGFWRNSDGKNPDPFTIISNKDTIEGVWNPVFLSLPHLGIDNTVEYVKDYTKQLEDSGRYSLCIWPPHCLIGSEGNNVFPVLFESLLEWEKEQKNNINYVSKGSAITTEHYSGVKAEVPDGRDFSTQLNIGFIEMLKKSDKILVAGEALSHCLKSTIEDIVKEFNDTSLVEKIVLLEDGTSPVISPFVDFPDISRKFVEEMKLKGMKTAKTTDF